MQREEWKSFLGGVALAAALILPTLVHADPAPPPPPPAPSSSEAIKAHVDAAKAEAKAAAEVAKARAEAAKARAEAERARNEAAEGVADGSWVNKPRATFQAKKVRFDSI